MLFFKISGIFGLANGDLDQDPNASGSIFRVLSVELKDFLRKEVF
jgi:hypothetical protein